MTAGFDAKEQEPETKRVSVYSQKSFIWTIAAILAVSTVITLFAAFAIAGDDGGPKRTPVVAGAVVTPSAATESPTEVPTAAAATETPAATAFATAPPTIASSSSATLAATQPVTATPLLPTERPSSLTPVAAALAASIESQYGVRIVLAGQDWGTTEEVQVRNISAVGEALAGVPATIKVAANARIPLAFLSNHTGATEAGWEPYGQREANYYSNEDVSTSGRVAANQIVLQPGSNSQTIAHEIMHAYQMREIAPGGYALALLTPEMKSFMEATGWKQTGSDDDVRAATGGGWDGINSLFEYEGRPLIYSNQFGDSLTLYTPNPLEAFAEAGGLFYGHNSALTLPDWPEYWDWFRSNTG